MNTNEPNMNEMNHGMNMGQEPNVVPLPEVQGGSPTLAPLEPSVVAVPGTEDSTVASFETASPEIVPLEPPVVAPPVVVSETSVPSVEAVPTSVPAPMMTMPTPEATSTVTMPTPEAMNPVTPPAEQAVSTVQQKSSSGGKGKTFGVILLFVLLIGFIVFLPDITTVVTKYLNGEYNNIEVEKILDGVMNCTMESTSSHFDKEYEASFTFTENRLRSMEFITVTKGDASLDEKELDEMTATCKELSAIVESVDGITVRCDYTRGILTETQNYVLDRFDLEGLSPAYYEAGGNSPTFDYGEDMDRVEKNMNASGYTCHREVK